MTPSRSITVLNFNLTDGLNAFTNLSDKPLRPAVQHLNGAQIQLIDVLIKLDTQSPTNKYHYLT